MTTVEPVAPRSADSLATESALVRLRAWITSPTGAAVAVGLIALAAAVGHMAILARYHGPWVFDDELGYERLGHSLATTGAFSLFGKQGLSYSPLYPLAIAPLYLFHLSAVAVYGAIKDENAVLMAVAVLPIYKIARFALPRGYAIAATGLSALAPLMLYSSLVMSESLAYPLFLFTFWALLVALRTPGWRRDTVVIALSVLCIAVRLQFIVLLPAALVAVILDGLVSPREDGSLIRRAWGALRAHRLLTGSVVGLALLVLAAWAGSAVLSLTGRYSNQRNLPFPSPWLIVKLFVEHVAGLDFAVGIIPFAGAVLAAYLWARSPSRSRVSGFASASLSATFFIVSITAVASFGQSYRNGHASTTGDIPRIHERYIFYLVPLFVIALLATTRLARTSKLLKLGFGAAAVATVLPVVIPYDVVINHTIAVDTFSLEPFAVAGAKGAVVAHSHIVILVVLYAAVLSLIYALARPNPVIVVLAVAVLFLWLSSEQQARLIAAAHYATKRTLPATKNWVDAAADGRSVALVQSSRGSGYPAIQTIFYNLSISRLYYTCDALFSSDMGEVPADVGTKGLLRDATGVVRAEYLVAPANAGIAGRVVAVDRPGHLVLLRPTGGVVRIAPSARSRWACP